MNTEIQRPKVWWVKKEEKLSLDRMGNAQTTKRRYGVEPVSSVRVPAWRPADRPSIYYRAILSLQRMEHTDYMLLTKPPSRAFPGELF